MIQYKKNKYFKGEEIGRYINAPIYQASSIVFDKLSDLDKTSRWYGRMGTDTNKTLEQEISKLENGEHTILLPSGLSAITTTILSLVKTGDHILVSEGIYGPTRIFCDNMLKKFGISTDYYPADCDQNIEKYIKKNTKLIFLESPSSINFEIPEIEEIVEIAKKHKIFTAIDSTYSGGALFKPLDWGVDFSVQSLSKYTSGHSDIIAGSVTCRDDLFESFWDQYYQLGPRLSPADCSLILRGLKTLELRLKEHQKKATEIALFLENIEEISQVIYPRLESFPQKKRFDKYFSGSNGIISFIFNKEISKEKIKSFVDSLEIFKIGFSWGGMESLIMYYDKLPESYKKNNHLPIIRVHIGLDKTDELKKDLTQAMKLINK